jgi:hypothetical protein
VAAEDITAVYSASWAGLPAGQIRVKLGDVNQHRIGTPLANRAITLI